LSRSRSAQRTTGPTAPVLTNITPRSASALASIHIVTDPATGRKTLTNATTAPARPTFIAIPPLVRLEPIAPSGAVTRDARGRIQRSEAARHSFARQTGFPNGRPGYVIDHIKPLACGGADAPSNMQWQTIGAAKAKDKTERVGCR
jgi:hypothetical protein